MNRVVHLEECEPEQHPSWQKMPYGDALALGATTCDQTKYMAEELFLDEQVWLEGCPSGPHRGPEGPNEDTSQCPTCWAPSHELRPEGETYGHHLPDCSLPRRHESYCQPGGAGHPPAPTIRGYWPEPGQSPPRGDGPDDHPFRNDGGGCCLTCEQTYDGHTR